MRGHDGGRSARVPRAVIGEIDCDVATSSMLEKAGLTGAAREASRHLVVSVPVTVRSVQAKSDLELVVSARLHSPRGCPTPVACAPSPAAESIAIPTVSSATVSVAPGIGTVGGGLNRTTNRQEVVSDVTGIGTDHLRWSIPGKHGVLAGSQEFRFFVRQDEVRHGWLEVTAWVNASRGLLRRGPSEPAVQRVWVPLVADSAPQAGATLDLLEEPRAPQGRREERDGETVRHYLGRPLDLPISLTPHGPAVGGTDEDGTVVGAFRWFDSVDGRPGFQWVQKSPDRIVLGEGQGTGIRPGTTVFLPNESLLRLPDGRSLRVLYADGSATGRPTLQEALDVSVVVDEAVVATYRTESNYVTIGRSLKDISVNRPDISRTHGTLELSDDGWLYTHLSGARDAVLLRGDETVVVRRDAVVPVRRHDTLVLNDHVSLTIR
ncbi:hypothetical protein [Streptomyces sp. rh34]|uniref:hypothetical protein n=1 Tax=Streptomyces sp. rh34 TaxID=2034272 RepID=UPI0015CF7F7A|nr:hypothetical protein [Streptomyces sp. rh34]